MFLQILPPDSAIISESIFQNQLVFVILGLTIGVFTILKITKYLSKFKFAKASTKPSYIA